MRNTEIRKAGLFPGSGLGLAWVVALVLLPRVGVLAEPDRALLEELTKAGTTVAQTRDFEEAYNAFVEKWTQRKDVTLEKLLGLLSRIDPRAEFSPEQKRLLITVLKNKANPQKDRERLFEFMKGYVGFGSVEEEILTLCAETPDFLDFLWRQFDTGDGKAMDVVGTAFISVIPRGTFLGEVRPKLLKMAQDREAGQKRTAAIVWLGFMRMSDDLPWLLELAGDEKEHRDVRAAALQSMEMIDLDRACVFSRAQALTTRDEDWRIRCLGTLVPKRNKEDLPLLLNALDAASLENRFVALVNIQVFTNQHVGFPKVDMTRKEHERLDPAEVDALIKQWKEKYGRK